MNNIVKFRLKPPQADIDGLTADLFGALSACQGIDADELAGRFLAQHPHLRRSAVMAASAFACRVIASFKKTLLGHIADGGGNAA